MLGYGIHRKRNRSNIYISNKILEGMNTFNYVACYKAYGGENCIDVVHGLAAFHLIVERHVWYIFRIAGVEASAGQNQIKTIEHFDS
jgi:hypothetical protein